MCPEESQSNAFSSASARELELLTCSTEEAIKAFIEELSRFQEHEWSVRPSAASWSAAEITEHVLLTNDRLLSSVQDHLNDPLSPEWRSDTANKEEWIRTVLPSQGKAKAGPALSAFVGITSPQAIERFSAFLEALTGTLKKAAGLPLHAITWPHAFLGRLSAFQWLLYIPNHTQRHSLQMQRTRALIAPTLGLDPNSNLFSHLLDSCSNPNTR